MYAIIESGIVVNVVVWDGDTISWQPPQGTMAIALGSDSHVAIGYSYDGSTFSAPADDTVENLE